MNTHVLSWKKCTNINILMIGGQKSLQYLEQRNIGLTLLNKVSNLDLVNIVDLRAMNWASLQCPIRGSIASSLTVTCTTLGGNEVVSFFFWPCTFFFASFS